MDRTVYLKSGSLLQGGRYRIEKFLGQGGFGITYLALQTALNRKVAIKEFFMKEHCNRDASTSQVSVGSEGSKDLVERFRKKFIKEAQTIAEMDNIHIIRIHDVFEENGTAYYVMEYLQGGDLKSRIPSGGVGESEALGYIRQIADALSYIHHKKILHLDIKPVNVLFKNNGIAVLIDFGISKHYDEAGGGQTSSTPVGISEGYAPTEQYESEGLSSFSASTDIYSLGATLYCLLQGERPPKASIVLNDGLPELPSRVSQSTIRAIEKAMSPRRKDRPQSVEEFMELLGGGSKGDGSDRGKDVDDDTELGAKGKKKETPKSAPETPSSGPVKSQSGRENGGDGGMEKEEARKAEQERQRQEAANSKGVHQGHEWVDLGLSVKWATCNVGANSPSDYGNHYAWGETTTKSEYTYENSKTCGKSIGDISGNPSYDAARANWGGSWRLPTRSEFEELINRCQWEWTTQNGHNGYRVTGPNGNTIFLPAAGWCLGSSLYRVGVNGYYWCSTPYGSDASDAYDLYFFSVGQNVDWGGRSIGQSVRPVLE